MANENIVLTEGQAVAKAQSEVPAGTIEQKAASAPPATVGLATVLPENAQSPPQADPSPPKLKAIPMPAKPGIRPARDDWRTRAAARAAARKPKK